MAAEEETDTLKLYWDHFFKAETGAYEKSTWLDLFLAEFLIRVSDGADPKELINFCPVSGVVTLVGCELLCGIHRVTSSINSHYAAPLPALDAPCSGAPPPRTPTPPPTAPFQNVADSPESKPEEARSGPTSLFTRHYRAEHSAEQALSRYLLRGVAWRCLVLLQALPVEGLSCCRQLSSVLIWLFGELNGTSNASGWPVPRLQRKTAIHELFSHKIWSKQEPTGGQAQSATPAERTPRRHTSQANSSKYESSRKSSRHVSPSSDSASDDDLQQLNRSLAIKLCRSDDFGYFDTRSSNDYPDDPYYDPYFTPRKAKPKPDDYMNDKHKEIINSEITTFQFRLIITDLLQELCKAESSLTGSEGSQISMQCINFSLRTLCNLQFSSVPQLDKQNTQEISQTKVALTELLMVSLDQVLIHSDLCAKLINNGILPMLLRLLEDVISKCKTNKIEYSKEDKTETENLLKFVFGIAYSITAFFHCLLMQCRSVDKLREFTEQFRLYGECIKGGLLKECVELMIRIPHHDEDAVILVKKLIETVGKLIVGMKRVRSEVIHSAACPRSRHKVCRQRVAAGMHHHHDVLGEASTGLPMSSACCVSLLYGTLTSLLTDEEVSAESILRNKILKVMLNSGVCCCFSPGFLMESIVRLMLTHNSTASLCLQVLEHSVYGELGASILMARVTDQLPCSICEPCDDKKETGKKYCSHGISPIERKSVWSFLYHYNSLLQLDNHNNVLHATVSHLLRVTPKCRMEMKYELLFSVIYPTFIVAKHRYMIRMEEPAYFLTVSCLNIFASLLNTVSFAEQFIQKGGLSYVLELVSHSEFSNQCCAILEIAITVEIFKLIKEHSELTYFREMDSLASVQMLFKSLTETTNKCFKIYKLKLPAETFEELCDVTAEREILGGPQPASQNQRKFSMPQAIKTSSSTNDFSIEETIEDHIEVLKGACTFWKTCASLCLCSPLFRTYVAGAGVFVDTFALLRLSLHALAHAPRVSHDRAPLLALVEALLTVQLSASDVTGGRSKRASCALVRGALSGAGGGPRALCDALLRVAAARPAPSHTLPRAKHAKVPPLLCASGASSECSSSEDSVAGPYASEHSEPYPTRPDEGYEADVEVGKLDLTPLLNKARKLSANASNTSGMQSPTLEMNSDGAEYKSGELAHPELCVIVVDILAQLINKLVSAKAEGSWGSAWWRVGVGAARAWCARVAAALARAKATHPPLLRRLLAQPHRDLLATTDPALEELQRSILELVVVVASASVSARELRALLRLAGAERAPRTLLLRALQRLFLAAQPNTPDAILSFPIDADTTDGVDALSEELGYVSVSGNTSQSHAAEACAKKYHDAHVRAGVQSAWACGAVRCGVEGGGWAPWLNGFALTAWLHTRADSATSHADDTDELDEARSDTDTTRKKPPKKETVHKPVELSHVFSIGHESLLFEVWLDTSTGLFTFRLSRPEARHNRVVGEARSAAGLPADRWTCVALNVHELVHKRHLYIQVKMFINGYECEPVSLPVQGILVRKAAATCVLLGHAGPGAGAYHVGHAGPGAGAYHVGHAGPGAGAYHVARAHVYRAPALSARTALHLAAHGPDHACQVRCEKPNYALIITPNVLDSDIDWDQVFEISATTLRELHDNLLLTFSAHAPNLINLYHQTVALPTVFAGRGVGAGPAGGSGAGVPEALFPAWAGRALPSRHRGVAPALYLLGGPDVLLYLYAKVVELEGSAEEQALALGILLRACAVDNRLHALLYAERALDMLLSVFAAPKCHVSHHLLKVVLDEACSASLLSACGDSVVLAARSDALLLQPELLVLLVRAWRHLDASQELTWEVDVGGPRGRGSAWALALSCLSALLRDQHPRRAFNHDQVARHQLLHHLLHACKERFLNSECGPLGEAGDAGLLELVRGLLGAPPALDRLAMLCDFLLLMHQASDTFVTHSRANFYFLLAAETQEMSEFCSVRQRARRQRRRSPPRHTDGASDNSLNVHKEAHTAQSESDDKMDSSGSADSSKHLKSIINQQIRKQTKEGRNHTTSSASDNSDTPAVGCEGGEGEVAAEGEGGAELNEYIVVDVDDVNHTTVEMYSSGIYEQNRVRAGASDGGTWREGLLLLLRHALAVLPDHVHQQVGGGGVWTAWAESLAVLSNQRASSARAAALRAAAALARRAEPELARRLLHAHYYVHLANQIALYEGSWELATAAAALLTKCDVPLEDQLDDDIWVDMTEESLQRSPPLLALLPCCVHDVPLAHNVSRLVRRIIDKASLKLVGELCVAEAAVRGVRALAGRAAHSEGRALLLQDLCDLLAAVALKALTAPHSMQTIVELHHMLSYVEACGDGSVRRTARDAQLALFHAQLDHLEARLRTSCSHHAKHANYFANVLSSAVSLGEGGVRGERAELGARHLATVTRAVNFLLSLSPREPVGDDALLMDRLLDTLLLAVSGAKPKWWAPGSTEWAGALQELFWWAAAPAAGARRLQPRLLRALYHAPAHAAHALTPHDPALLRKLTVYLLSMIQHIHGTSESCEDGDSTETVELPITDWARSWAVGAQAELAQRPPSDTLGPEAAALLKADEERWQAKVMRIRPAIAKVVFGREALATRVTDSAMAVTRGVVDAQNAQRKAYMEQLRRAHAHQAAAAQAWQLLIDAHTHEQAVWFEPSCWPQSWQLDATEGPGRVRVRLRRAHLHVQPKFLKPQHRHKAERARRPGPLSGVVGPAPRARLQPHESVLHMARVTCVGVAAELEGELLLSERALHFVPDGDVCIPEVLARPEAHSWPLEHVTRLATRRWCLQERALELFTSSGHAHLLAFADLAHRNAFLKAYAACQHPARIEPDSLTEAMTQWRNGSITNWEYLMRLNGLGGRSYNDLMQYPVLPFVLADYTSRILDLTDPKTFRDLSRPMAVQNKSREQHYINMYNDLKAARREGGSALAREPHHYASLYSNSGGVLHYLVRMPPFTELFLNYQDNNFDMPDRTFHSLATTWRLITNDSPTDVKELIPELFYLPELFHNGEGLALGVRQCGEGVDNVELPAWAPDARLFTLLHRQALESPLVTDALPHWIDLVFGYKQTGQAALDAINVFPACTYYGFDPSALADSLERSAARAMVRTYGQAPRQLLRTPHPHQQPDLLPSANDTPVWSGVVGARWGRWCGAPGAGAPRVVARRALAAGSLLALPAPRAAAVVPPGAALLAIHGEAVANSNTTGATQPLGVLTWTHSDSLLRLKRRRDARPDLLMHVPPLDQITTVASSCVTAGCPCPLALGHASGRVLLVRVRVAAGAPRARSRALHAHRAPVSAMYMCPRASLLVTASEDGVIVLWDLHRLSYIRTLPNRGKLPVTCVTISETLSDVASVHDMTSRRDASDDDRSDDEFDAHDANGDNDTDDYEKDAAYRCESLIRVYTVNAKFVGSVKVSERVTCICYSCAPEGVSVNGIAAGLRTGAVRIYSSWDLRALRYIPPPDLQAPLISVTYSSECSVLFGCYAGAAVAWDCDDSARPAPARLLPAHHLL